MDELEKKDELGLPARVECTFEKCSEQVLGKCRNCALAYCLEHASDVDPANYCINCLVPADAEVKEEPLVDANGIRHAGRIIHPIGKAYRRAEKMVYEMSEEELKNFIEQLKVEIHNIENLREYKMISLGLATAEVYRRDIAACKKEGSVLKFGFETQYVPAIKAPREHRETKSRVSKSDKVVDMLKGLGLGPADLVNLLRSIPSKKGK